MFTHNITLDTILDKVVDLFSDYHVSDRYNISSLGHILRSIDKCLSKRNDHRSSEAPSMTHNTTSDLINQVESLRTEIETLRAQLSSEIEQLRRENTSLKEKLCCAQMLTTSHFTNTPEFLPQQHQTAESHPTSHDSTEFLSEATVRKFNLIPRTLKAFVEQMENRCEEFPKFSDISEPLRKCKRTKGSYCKRKVIYTFILNHSDGKAACLSKFSEFSPLQLYEQHIKSIKRQQMCEPIIFV